jgi:uncharacterized protein (DUF1778 family)
MTSASFSKGLEKLRCVVAGSRGITSLDVVRAAVAGAPFFDRVGTIGSGGARGVDTLAGVVAAELGLPFVEMPADWDQHGKRAGYLRNAEMAVWAKETPPGALVAAWDGFSRGTRHMIDLANEHGLLVHIVVPAEPIVLSEGEVARLVEILENPPPPNEALRRAMSTFDGKIRPTRRKP